MLDVKPQTLYAYVSRGLVRSRPTVGSRRREYHVADLHRVSARSGARAGHAAVASGALRWGEPVLDSALTEIRDGDFAYRGRRVTDLAAAGTGFEAVAHWLWTGRDDGPARWPELRGCSRLPKALVGAATRPFDAMLTAVAWQASRDPQRDATQPAVVLAVGRRLTATLVEAIASWARTTSNATPTTVAGALASALGRRPSPRVAAEIDRALILVADHELNPSSFAARVAASAGADLYASTAAALATLSGPRHGGMTGRVEALLAEVGRPEHAAAVVADRFARGDAVPGFGHPLYPVGDPRPGPLLEAARRLAPARVAVVTALVDAMTLAGGDKPTIDLGLVALAVALDLPAGSAAAMFAVGRCAGWVAHALEQREAGFILRPRARFVGTPRASASGSG